METTLKRRRYDAAYKRRVRARQKQARPTVIYNFDSDFDSSDEHKQNTFITVYSGSKMAHCISVKTEKASDQEKGVCKTEIKSPRCAEVTDEVVKKKRISVTKRKYRLSTSESDDDSWGDDRSHPELHLSPRYSEETGLFDVPIAVPSTQSSERLGFPVGHTQSTTSSREVAEEEMGLPNDPTAAPSTQSSQRFGLSIGPTTSTPLSREIAESAEDSPSRGSNQSIGSSVTDSLSKQSHKLKGTNRTSSKLDCVRNRDLQDNPLSLQGLENKIEEVKTEIEEGKISLSQLKDEILDTVKKALSQFKDEILEAVKDKNFDDDPIENLNQLFPAILTTVEEVEQFEEHLSEKSYRKAMVDELAARYAHKDVKAVIRGVMRHLMTRKLMGQYSFKGSRGKKSLVDSTRLHGLIRGVARRFLPKEDKEADIVINNTIASVLRFAPHGEGGEKFKSRSRPSDVRPNSFSGSKLLSDSE